MPYSQKQVDRGRKLVATLSKSKFALGDLALEIAPTVGGNDLEWVTSPAKTELEEFAEKIGTSYHALRTYRNVAAAFILTQRRDDLSFSVHQTFVTQDKPSKVLHQRKVWTVRTARDYLGRPPMDPAATTSGRGIPAGQTGVSPSQSRQERVQIAKEVLADPDIVDEIVRDTRTGAQIAQGQMRASRDLQDHHANEREMRKRNGEDGLDVFGDLLDAERALRDAGKSLKVAVTSINDAGRVPSDHREMILGLIEDVEALAGWVRSAVGAGIKDMDEALTDLLERGE